MTIYEKDAITWKELYELVMDWLEYGDDPFYDRKADLSDNMEEEKDERVKKNMEYALKLMDFLEDKMHW